MYPLVVCGLSSFSICSLLSLSLSLSLSLILSYVLRQLISKSVLEPASIRSHLFVFKDFSLEAHK